MTTFTPKPCPCGCKKWIMSPWFNCQCSSLSTAEKDELMEMARDATRYRELRRHKLSIGYLNRSPVEASPVEQSSLDAAVDILIITRKEENDDET